jgi:hypothetical protein
MAKYSMTTIYFFFNLEFIKSTRWGCQLSCLGTPPQDNFSTTNPVLTWELSPCLFLCASFISNLWCQNLGWAYRFSSQLSALTTWETNRQAAALPRLNPRPWEKARAILSHPSFHYWISLTLSFLSGFHQGPSPHRWTPFNTSLQILPRIVRMTSGTSGMCCQSPTTDGPLGTVVFLG